jgi:DNA-binding LacI/PurR family transcriptional regulator
MADEIFLDLLNRFSIIGSVGDLMVEAVNNKRITIKDIAARAGVGKATVSYVLNATQTKVSISEETRKRVLQVVKECGYHPNAAARALSARRTGQIGFILSDTITGGWANMFFARIFTGVEQACRKRGYGLNASLYNLSNIDSFVFPPKVGQRAVDGLVLCDYVEAAVVERFKEFGIPCVCIGDNIEVAELVPTVACDIVGGTFDAIRFAASLGHRHILYCMEPSRRGREVGQTLVNRARADSTTQHCRISLFEPEMQSDYSAAGPMTQIWMKTSVQERPTVVIASDQTLIAFLGELNQYGLQCPRDVSLISNCDTHLCSFSYPPITSVSQDLEVLGGIAVDLLVDHLDESKPLTPEMSQNNHPCKLILRKSCGPISTSK